MRVYLLSQYFERSRGGHVPPRPPPPDPRVVGVGMGVGLTPAPSDLFLLDSLKTSRLPECTGEEEGGVNRCLVVVGVRSLVWWQVS